ncbi:MAG: UDP-N-acetylmuramoyl-L-alanyl-D-glutamate--2,6-diaminopimelate ligase [Burkholderiaceae bacterium]|nr:UDP-N-acetylmuramoyl-L-alanyl-D-glutamate--2,6-diaminopimelate ligase [Burkholderiaceae bacterium]
MTLPKTQPDQIVAWLHATVPGAQLVSDSRRIKPSSKTAFFAYPGDEADGRTYIADAIARGATAVVYDVADYSWPDNWSIPHLAVTGLKNLAGPVAAIYYQQPDAGMFTVAITGTNGKTSCSQWIASALSQQGDKTAAIGTLGIGVFQAGEAGSQTATGYTTPDAVLLQSSLAGLRDEGVSALAIEASSIGLDQGRLNGMHFDVALFTNFTRDHLDYHHDMASYAAAKEILFNWPGLRHAVINLDDPMGVELAQRYRHKLSVTGYSLEENGYEGMPILRASGIRSRSFGTEFQVDSPFGSGRVKTHLVGRFNVSNVLGVLGVLLIKGVKWDAAIETIGTLAPAPGRMQLLGGREAPMVVVDYAHTPDALAKTLGALRSVAQERNGQLWCVFGCGGDRDQGKRPQMGNVAEIGADHVVVTSDNPRSEDQQQIIAQIVGGMKTAPQTIEDRAAAILLTVKQAAKQDVILVAGKGHENYQEARGTKYPFVDAEHAALALAARATMKRGAE